MVNFIGRISVLEGVDLSEAEEETLSFTFEQTSRVYAERAGMFVSDKQVGRWVSRDQELGYIYDSFNGNVISKVTAPVSGLLTGIRRQPMLFEGDLLFRICRKAI